jgi:N-hydroxyarylamine O-acetyltransferase
MVGEGFGLDAYLASRIGYEGPREPSLPALRGIVAPHSAAIAFENIDVLLKRDVSLDLLRSTASSCSAVVGGYCFEQNTVLGVALRVLGFSLVTLIARVVRGLPESAATPRSPAAATGFG